MRITEVQFFARKKIRRPDKGTEELTAFSGSGSKGLGCGDVPFTVAVLREEAVKRLHSIILSTRDMWRKGEGLA